MFISSFLTWRLILTDTVFPWVWRKWPLHQTDSQSPVGARCDIITERNQSVNRADWMWTDLISSWHFATLSLFKSSFRSFFSFWSATTWFLVLLTVEINNTTVKRICRPALTCCRRQSRPQQQRSHSAQSYCHLDKTFVASLFSHLFSAPQGQKKKRDRDRWML